MLASDIKRLQRFNPLEQVVPLQRSQEYAGKIADGIADARVQLAHAHGVQAIAEEVHHITDGAQRDRRAIVGQDGELLGARHATRAPALGTLFDQLRVMEGAGVTPRSGQRLTRLAIGP
jgi:hypothetical protein